MMVNRERPATLALTSGTFLMFFCFRSSVPFLYALPGGPILVKIDDQYLSDSSCQRGQCQRYHLL
jgi:hypothetical protein